MANNDTNGFQSIEPYLVAYYELCLIIIGTFLNCLTVLIFCRARFRNGDEKPTMHYMRAIAIVDILMLYGWNLDHYLTNIYGFDVGSASIAACKIALFVNFLHHKCLLG